MNSTNSTNSTSRTFSSNFIISVTVIFATTVLLVLLENILVILTILSSRQLRQVRSNLFLVGLAVADIFTSLTLIPFQLVQLWSSPNWPLGDVGVKVYNSMWNFCMVVPFLTVLAITVDRYLAITRQTYSTQVTSKGVIGYLVFIWVYTTIWVLLLSITFRKPPHNEYAWNVPNKYYYPYLFIHVLVPLIIICYCYIMILVSVRKTQREITDSSMDYSVGLSSSVDHQLQTEIKLTKTIGYIVLALVIVWFTVLCLEVVYGLDNVNTWTRERYKLELVGIISLWLICSNGVINPVIYSIRSERIRSALKHLLTCRNYEQLNQVL